MPNNNHYESAAEIVASEIDQLMFHRMDETLRDMGAQLDLIATEHGRTELRSFHVTQTGHGYKISVSTRKTAYISRRRF